MKYRSWGLLTEAESTPSPSINPQSSNLVLGNLRSYGDVCLNDGGAVILSRHLNNILAFDAESKLIVAESGILLGELLEFLVPRGYFLPVSPGTRYVTLGGAIANDVHGKNHHVAGNFGNHVEWFDLERSDGTVIRCSPQENPHLFRATIGGLGLTGFIRRAAFRVMTILSSGINAETIPFRSLHEFFEINQASKNYPYTVAWLDCLTTEWGKARGMGIYFRGDHAAEGSKEVHREPILSVPFMMPSFLLNSFSIQLFNLAYQIKAGKWPKKSKQHYSQFFYPLDGINHWNRGYGASGFYQFQFVIPFSSGVQAFSDILDVIVLSGQGSFLAVLKTFGSLEPQGMLSFPKEGITLALDFQNKGAQTLILLKRLEEMVLAAGGRIYPAKDAMMSAQGFLSTYPEWNEFLKYKDPQFSSNFYRRVMEGSK